MKIVGELAILVLKEYHVNNLLTLFTTYQRLHLNYMYRVKCFTLTFKISYILSDFFFIINGKCDTFLNGEFPDIIFNE